MSTETQREAEALDWVLASLYLSDLTRYEGLRDGWLTREEADLLPDADVVKRAEANS